jgi:hypothetical protein
VLGDVGDARLGEQRHVGQLAQCGDKRVGQQLHAAVERVEARGLRGARLGRERRQRRRRRRRRRRAEHGVDHRAEDERAVGVGDAGERRKAEAERELARVAGKDAVHERRAERSGGRVADAMGEKLVNRGIVIDVGGVAAEQDAKRREKKVVEKQRGPDAKLKEHANDCAKRGRQEIEAGVGRQKDEATRGDAFGGHAESRREREAIEETQHTQRTVRTDTAQRARSEIEDAARGAVRRRVNSAAKARRRLDDGDVATWRRGGEVEGAGKTGNAGSDDDDGGGR